MTSIRTIGHAGLDSIRTRLTAFVEQSPRSGPMVVAAVVGAVSGIGAVLFLWLIELVEWLIIDQLYGEALADTPGWLTFLAPALGGLLVAPIVMHWVPEARGGGVPGVIIAVETRRSRIRPRVAIGKAVASALTLGSGGSGGTEGPIVQIGSTVGSTMGQILRLSEENTRLLLASGAAAGVAAVFNAPIAGVFFALEVILRQFTTRNFSVVVLASVVGTVTAVAFRGDAPALDIPEYRLQHPAEIFLFPLLGALAAFVAIAFTRLLYAAEDLGRRQRAIPMLLLPAVGGVLVGLLGLWNSGALGIGEDATDAALLGALSVQTMVLLLALKMVATVITLASGGSSGVFRPSLMMGAMLGGAFGITADAVLPADLAPPGAYAVVGMAAVFGGAARAPITSILIIFEMTRDYDLMLPLMTATVAATVVATMIDRLNIYTRRLHMLGIHLRDDSDAPNVMQALRVTDAMGPITLIFAPDTPLNDVARTFAGDREAVALVLNEAGEVLGVLTNTDVNEALVRGWDQLTALDLSSKNVRTIYSDASLHEALAALAGQSFTALPVVERGRPRVPRGILRRADITNAYAIAVERRETTHRRNLLRTSVREDVRYLDYQVRPNSPAVGVSLRDLPLSEDAVVVAVRHEGHTVIPRGHTLLQEGDRVSVIALAEVVDAVRALFDSR